MADIDGGLGEAASLTDPVSPCPVNGSVDCGATSV